VSVVGEDGSQLPIFEQDLVRMSVRGEPLSPFLTMLLYAQGVFPWLRHKECCLWWSPQPRSVLFARQLHVSRSLRKTIRSGKFIVTADLAFDEVLSRCRDTRETSWIDADIERVFGALHRLGHAHSVETWRNGELVGGLYGLAIGRMFFGCSMFHSERDASKVALVKLVERTATMGFPAIACQVQNAHLKRMGSRLILREKFHTMVADLIRGKTVTGPWTAHFT
jgi:leucyl/phenylalanyl-tRNA--protein transferase